ncbi:hypothetical protein L0F63_000296 [Massospora cicadina]|nr:hypothetical protein L0F63_000296 [Massospora cicadina]
MSGITDMGYKKGAVVILMLINMITGLAFIWLAIFDASAGNIVRYSFLLPMILSLAGLYAIIFSLHGLLAIVAESKKQLAANSIMTAISLIINGVILAVLGYGRFTVGHRVSSFWLDAYKRRVYLIRNIEEEFQCCGLRDTTDHAFPNHGNVTCLNSVYFGYTTPCYWLLKNSVENEMDVALGWVTAAVVIQLCAFVLTLKAYRAIAADEERAPLLSRQET